MNFKALESGVKLRGGYYTQHDIALFLIKWILKTSPKHLLEPSCGDGAFLSALKSIKHENLKQITAFDIEESEIYKAREKARSLKGIETKINNQDFLYWSLLNFHKGPLFDAVVGNPPFIRYQYLEKDLQAHSQKIFEYFHLPFTKHTNAWVPFIISSIALLRPGGRLAMVVPSEILHVLHAQSLRTFLANQSSKILIFDPEELWFEDALQGAVLLLAEKKKQATDKFHGISIKPTKSREFLGQDPEFFFEQAEFTNGETLSGKWMKALLTKKERELFKDVSQRKDIYRFKEIADVDVGIVTGANKFFLVNDETVRKYGLEKWAHPMFGRSEHVPGIIYDIEVHYKNKDLGFPTNFIWFDGVQFEKLPAKVKEYILEGEKQKLNERYKCSIRKPWYNVPSVYVSPIGMLKRSHHFPRLILNRAEALTTDTAYRVKPKNVLGSSLVYSFVNSLTALSAELEGRHYGGGVLELVPSEIEKVLIPLPAVLDLNLDLLDKKIRGNELPEEILLAQDKNVLQKIGLNKKERELFLTAWMRLKSRRQRSFIQ